MGYVLSARFPAKILSDGDVVCACSLPGISPCSRRLLPGCEALDRVEGEPKKISIEESCLEGRNGECCVGVSKLHFGERGCREHSAGGDYIEGNFEKTEVEILMLIKRKGNISEEFFRREGIYGFP